jgi:serine/threonine protein kinase
MASIDAATLANLAMRLTLLGDSQVQEGWQELGARNGDPDEFLRVMERKGYLTPFQSSKLIKGDTDGYFLGGYRLLYKIASGSFGRVYRADDPNSGRVVAIKVLRKKWSEDKRKIELFTREGKMGMTLHHPNIVEILAVNQDRATRQYYIVMEFVEGGNLRDLINIRGRLQAAEVLRILEETASALAYAFSQGVTHRDMKLTNILLSSQRHVKLVDFGLAGGHVGFEEKEDTSVDRTVDYAGLEKATGAPSGDPRSDIFFLGCVAYELLTGRSPLEMTRNAQARMQAQRFLKIPPMTPDEVQGPPSLFRLVDNMIALNPDERFQTAAQLIDRVKEARLEVEGRPKDAKGQRTLFLIEAEERLKDLLRDKFKERGFRVLLASDPQRALDRFRQQPFELLVVNASTAGGDSCEMFERIIRDARRQKYPCGGVLLVGEDQTEWQGRFTDIPGVAVLVQPVKFKQLTGAMQEVLDASAAEVQS